jgi:DNA end-binding protein Ku
MARALWRGSISFGLVNIPVALYPAASNREDISFRLLHREDLSRVRNRRVDENDHDVPYEEVVRGYEYEKERYVVLEEEDLKRANVEATQTIDIMHFVAADQIDVSYYHTPYYTEPSKTGRKAYVLLRETLKRTGKVGVATIVVRERQHLCAVLADGPALLAFTLRWPYQLRTGEDLDLPGEDLDEFKISSQELQMAEQLVEAMSSDWQPEQYRDTYREDLLRLIDRKIQGGEVAGAAEPAAQGDAADVVDIMALLKRSMERRRKEEKQAALDGDAGVAGGGRTEASEKPAAAVRSDAHTKTKRAG